MDVRINVIGTSGSGKTTFGKQVAEALDLPFIEMDALFWGPNWKIPPDDEFFPRLLNALEGEKWVLDGNYTRTMGFKWDRVQAVIWLKYCYPRTIYQAIKRALTRLFDQKELWPGTGNRENLKILFSRDSIVWYTIRKYHRQNKRNDTYFENDNYSQINFHQIHSPNQAKHFLKMITQDSSYIIDNTNR